MQVYKPESHSPHLHATAPQEGSDVVAVQISGTRQPHWERTQFVGGPGAIAGRQYALVCSKVVVGVQDVGGEKAPGLCVVGSVASDAEV